MPNQDYDINPKQTKSPKRPNRINPALMTPLPDLPRTIVGGNEKDYEDILERAFDPQNLKRSAELMKRPIPEQEPESIIEVKDPRIFDEYRIPEDSQQDDDKSISAISQQISEQSESEISQQSNIPPTSSISLSPIAKIPLDSTLEDFQSEDEESLSEVPQKIAGPTVSVVSQRDDHKSISAILQKISGQSEPETSQQSNLPPTSSISLSPIMEMPQQADVQSSTEPQQQIGIEAIPKTPRQEQAKTVVSTRSQEDALPIAVSPQQVVMQFFEENREQIALRALVQAVQQDNMQPVLETPIQTQAGTIISTLSQADTQPIAAPLQQADTQSAEENMEQMALQALIQVIQQDNTQPVAVSTERMALQELAQRAQPVAGAQQQNQNGILTPQHFEDYINSGVLPKHTQSLIHGLKDYIINNGFSEKATKDHIVYWIGCDVAYTCLLHPKRAISNDLIQGRIDQVKAFFSWIAENHIYNNIANDISIDAIKKIADELIMNPSLVQKMKEQVRVESAVQQPITANAPRQQPAFLRVPPPVINIPMQPTPGNRQPIQNNILTPQHFKDYIDLHYLPLRNKYTILQLGIYITETSSGQATRETIIYWIGQDLAQNIYANEPISDDQIQELIDYITAFFNWAAENHIYNNNIASNISIEDIKRKAYEILNSPSFTQAFTKVHVGKPRR